MSPSTVGWICDLLSRVFEVSKTEWTWRWYVLKSDWTWGWFGVKIHLIRPLEDEWHNHPWHGFSIVFGSYEEQLDKDGPWRTVQWFNLVGAHREHRTRGSCFTLFFHGPRVNEHWHWGEEEKPWRGPQCQSSEASK